MSFNSNFTESNYVLQKYFNDIRKYKPLSKQEEHNLINNGKWNNVIESNLKYVVTLAKKYKNSNVELNDLISSGNSAIISASKSFNTDYDVKFISYAKECIENELKSYINDNSRTVKMPMSAVNKIKKDNKNKCSELIINQYNNNNNNRGDELLNKIIIDNESDNNNNIINNNDISNHLNNIIDNKLNEKEQFVIKNLYGFNNIQKNVVELSKELKISEQRVIRVKDKAMRKLRNNSESLFELYKK